MRLFIIVGILVTALNSIAGEITCGEVVKVKSLRSKLELQVTVKNPHLVESLDLASLRGTLYQKEKKREVISVLFNRLEEYSTHVIAEDAMIKGVQTIYKKAYVCHSNDFIHIGVDHTNELALRDLIERLKD